MVITILSFRCHAGLLRQIWRWLFFCWNSCYGHLTFIYCWLFLGSVSEASSKEKWCSSLAVSWPVILCARFPVMILLKWETTIIQLWYYCNLSLFFRDKISLEIYSLSHPGLGWLYVLSSFPPPPPPRPHPPPRQRPPPQQLLPLTSRPFELNLRYLAQRLYGSGEMYWMTSPWPWPKVTAVASINKICLSAG